MVVNQVSRSGEGRTIRNQLQQVVDRFVVPTLESKEPFRLELLGEVPTDPSVREAVQRRQLLLESLPGCEAAKAVMAVAAKLSSS
jgi:flagellar biosynthesis protein FlhG